MNILYQLASRYGNATANIQTIINSALTYEQNSTNEEFTMMIDKERQLISLFYQIEELKYNVYEFLPLRLREAELTQTKNAIRNAIAEQENRLNEYRIKYLELGKSIRTLAQKYNYQLFSKAV